MSNMSKLALVGSCPSSGSTLLADLLDSTPYSACGVETGIFANKKIYNFNQYKKNIYQTSSCFSPHRKRSSINFNRLHSYGLNIEEYKELVTSSKTINNFAQKFANNFIALRGKEDNAVVFDKTPINLNCIELFLENFKDAYFINIVRNPLFVYTSLLSRGFSPYVAMASWLTNVAKYLQYQDHQRVISIKYEDLCSHPFITVQNIIQTITGQKIKLQEIQDYYGHNKYRKIHSKKKLRWTITTYGEIRNANNKSIKPNDLLEFSKKITYAINAKYGEHFDLKSISFRESIEKLGYQEELEKYLNLKSLTNKTNSNSKNKFSLSDNKKLAIKWLSDFLNRDANLIHLPAYCYPIINY